MDRFEYTRLKFHIPRLILGAIFVFSGLNGFFRFLPDPDYNEAGQHFIDNLRASNFWWIALKCAELVGGSLLISGNAGRFGVLILAPVTLAIGLFHLILSPRGAALGYTALALEVLLIIMWRKNLFRFFHHPHRTAHPERAH